MAEHFGCCSFWVECSVLGYCVHREQGYHGKYNGHTHVFYCALGRNMFVLKLEGWSQKWYESAIKHFKEHTCLEIDVTDRETFETYLANWKLQPKTTSYEYSDPWTHITAGIKVKDGDVWMPKQTIIAEKDDLQLVSWLYKDIVHYGIQDKEGGMLEVYKPTPSLRGQALRAHVMQLFKSRKPGEYKGRWPAVAMCVKDLEVGQIIVYESRPGKVIFSKIVQIGQSLIIGLTLGGDETLWLTDRMNSKMQNQEITVVALDTIPEQYRNFPKSRYEVEGG